MFVVQMEETENNWVSLACPRLRPREVKPLKPLTHEASELPRLPRGEK